MLHCLYVSESLENEAKGDTCNLGKRFYQFFEEMVVIIYFEGVHIH